MLKLRINDEPFEIKNNWEELTFGEWLEVKTGDMKKIVELFLNIPDASPEITQAMLPYFYWMQIPIQPETWKLKPVLQIGTHEVKTDIDIRTKTFGQKLVLQQVMNNEQKASGSFANACHTAISLYIQPIIDNSSFDYEKALYLYSDILKLNLCDAYTFATSIFNQLIKICDRENKELAVTPSIEQIRAGLDMFDEFGVNNTVDALAGGDVLKYKDVYELDYNTVFLKLKRSKVQGIYEKRYFDIMKQK